MDSMNATLRALGALHAINYEGQQQGTDVYDVRFENGEPVWLISLSQDGKIATLLLNRPTFAQSETEHRLRQVMANCIMENLIIIKWNPRSRSLSGNKRSPEGKIASLLFQ